MLIILLLLISANALTYDCTVDGLKQSVNRHSESISQFFLSPMKAAEVSIAYLTNTEKYTYDTTRSNLGSTFFNLDRYKGTWIDRSSEKIAQTYITAWGATDEVDFVCLAAKRGTISEDELVNVKGIGCTKNHSDQLIDYCPKNFPQCPNTTFALTQPWNYREWLINNSTKKCPVYCLDPSRYNNSLIYYHFQYKVNYEINLQSIYEKFREYIAAFYYCGVQGDVKYVPDSAFPDGFDMAIVFDFVYGGKTDDILFPELNTVHPISNPNGYSTLSRPYYDDFSQDLVSTGMTPDIAESGEFRGALAYDIHLSSTIDLLEQVKPTTNTMAIIINRKGKIISASPTVLNIIFCPDPTLSKCNGGVFDYQSYIKEYVKDATPIGLVDANTGTDVVVLYISIDRSGTFTLTISGKQYYAAWSYLNIPGSDYILLALTPVEDIDNAAVWQFEESKLIFHQSISESKVVSINNKGTLAVHWEIETNHYPLLNIVPSNGVIESNETVDIIVTPLFDKFQNQISYLLSVKTISNTEYSNCFPSIAAQSDIKKGYKEDEIIKQGVGSVGYLIFITLIVSIWVTFLLLEHIIGSIKEGIDIHPLKIILSGFPIAIPGIFSASLLALSSINYENMSSIYLSSEGNVEELSNALSTDLRYALPSIIPITFFCTIALYIATELYKSKDDKEVTKTDTGSSYEVGTMIPNDMIVTLDGINVVTTALNEEPTTLPYRLDYYFSVHSLLFSLFIDIALIIGQIMVVESYRLSGEIRRNWTIFIITNISALIIMSICISIYVKLNGNRIRLVSPFIIAMSLSTVILVDNATLKIKFQLPKEDKLFPDVTILMIISGVVIGVSMPIFMWINNVFLKGSKNEVDHTLRSVVGRWKKLLKNYISVWKATHYKDNQLRMINSCRPGYRKHETPTKYFTKEVTSTKSVAIQQHLSNAASVVNVNEDVAILTLLENPVCCEYIKDYFISQYSVENILFYLDVLKYKKLATAELRYEMASDMISTYINIEENRNGKSVSDFGERDNKINMILNIDPTMKKEVVRNKTLHKPELFDKILDEIIKLIKTNGRAFMILPEYQICCDIYKIKLETPEPGSSTTNKQK